MLLLVIAGSFFAGIHLGVAGTTLRDRLIASLGLNGYLTAFSIASVLGLVAMVIGYNRAPYVETWGMLEWWKPFAIALMLPSVLLAAMGLTTPNPTAVGQQKLLSTPPSGIVRVTRHPFLTGVAIWAAVHAIGNGDLASLLFFGTWIVVAAAGTVSIDAKRRRLLDSAAWDAFTAQTSIIPFVAIVAGRNRFIPGEIGLWRWLAGFVIYALLLGGHAHLVGVSPFPA